MFNWILTQTGTVISLTTVQRISNEEKRQTSEEPASMNLIVRLAGA